MGWFNEQIKQRKLNDSKALDEAFRAIADAVMGKKVGTNSIDESYITKASIDAIVKWYGYTPIELDPSVEGLNNQIEYLIRPHGIMYREIELDDKWDKTTFGAILAFEEDDNSTVALLPNKFGKYMYYDSDDEVVCKVNKKNKKQLKSRAYYFYKPLPLRKITPLDLVKYSISALNYGDIITIVVLTGLVTLIGLVTPRLSHFLFSTVIDSKDVSLLITTIFFTFCIFVSQTLIGIVKEDANSIISSKMSILVQSATMMRILSLPANFFRKYSSGELASRTSYVNSLSSIIVSTIFSTSLTSLFSLVNVTQIFVYAPSLVIPSLIIILTTVIFSIVSSLIQTKISYERMNFGSKSSSLSYDMISGVQKIKVTGSEKRAFARWAKNLAEQYQLNYNPPAFIKYNGIIASAISLFGNVALYYMAISARLSVADYYAFQTAYGMTSGAISGLASIALTVANIKPTLEMARPILEAEPEISEGKKAMTNITGAIEINNVSFKYEDNTVNVLDNLSLKIKPGQYVAVVGKTGCGKSTLVRLMLGFEKPQTGGIYYDGYDIDKIDLKSLRRNIGVVMQDGKLFAGEIFSNIVIAAPWLTMEDAWEAAEIANIADDIREMPMGMYTYISEGSGGISGGQKQRLMIARAIAPKCKILIFDEATSALDNITQKKVSEALDNLNCTRIVIAHRLSTIKHCDRILYLEDGKIIEDGTYEELISLNGKFAELVERQRLETE